MFTADFVS